jgi:hypothetical protein
VDLGLGHMFLKSYQALLSGLLCTVVMQTGCATKKPVASPYGPFRLLSLNDDSLLLTPAIPENHANDTAVNVILAGGAATLSMPTNCSVERGPFRLEQATNDAGPIRLTMPAPTRWLGDLQGREEPDAGDDVEALYSILADADQLQQKGCFAGAGTSIRDFIRQSVPMRPNESLFNAYGYRVERSSLELKPGMRLKIERAYFRPAEAGEEERAEKNFTGVSAMYFDVELTSDGLTRFLQVGDIQYSPKSVAQTVQQGRRDLGLRESPPELHYRLLFYTYLVPKKSQRSAAIIGSRDAGQLDELDRELRVQSDENCTTASAAHKVTCFEFDGFVTLSCQISVELNGKAKFVDWGAKVKDVLSKDGQAAAPKSLKIQRRFLNSYYDVRFAPGDSHVLSLALVGGDRLRWSKSGSVPR